MYVKTIARIGIASLVALCAAASSYAQVQASGGTGVVPAAKVAQFFQNYAVVAIPSELTATVTKDGRYGAYGAYNPATGQAVLVAGIGGSGTFATKASGRGGPCATVGGYGIDATLSGGSSSFVYYQANATTEDAVPATTADADALFRKFYGANSLPDGQSLTNLRAGPNGKAAALYWKGSQTLNWTLPSGKKAAWKITVLKGLALVNGKLGAIYAAGSGTLWGRFAP